MAEIPIHKIVPNPEQPRKTFDPCELADLAATIVEHGVILPVVVEPSGDKYILHDGERRWRAAKIAGLATIPASIVGATNGDGSRVRLVRALVANIQRADLNPIEEARAFQTLRDDYGMSVADISRKVGRASTVIYQRLKLLELDSEIQELVALGKFPVSSQVIDAVMKIRDAKLRIQLAKGAAERKSSNRAIISAAHRLVERERERAQKRDPQYTPAISQALAKARKYTDLPMKWDALAQVGTVPPWEVVVKSARATCRACVLRSSASETVCKMCPAPEMIGRMIVWVEAHG